jgi:uracil phosphoribosyltransferase
MKEHFLTLLRSQETEMGAFREAARGLSSCIAAEIAAQLPLTSCRIKTPLEPTKGKRLKDGVILIPILRAGLVLLSPFLDLFPGAPVGFFGIRHDEKSALPHLYYENMPPISPTDRILLLDPMLATGGSALLALRKLKEKKADLARVTLVTILAAPEGMRAVQDTFPEVTIYTVAVDEKLNQNKYIVPGLGDFGDRYFGTELQITHYTG